MAMTLLTLFLIGTACDDKMDNPTVNPSTGKQVEVSLNIGFANEEDGISLSNSRSSNTAAGEKASTQKLAFDAQLISAVETRAGEAKPDQLYNLEIRQYDASGTCKNSSQAVIANQSIGSKLTINLTEMEDCQLVIVAWGTSISNRLGTDTFSKACDVMIDQSAIKDLDPTNLDDMKKMPYYIYLPSVKVSANTITNPDGTDVRLLLKRLATRVTLNWNYAYTTYYDLKEVRLEGVPTHYRAIPFINTADNTYPSLFDQYTTIIVPDNIPNQGSYSCWIPATLRGTSNKATSAYYRNKENAPTGSVYATFVAQNKTEEKKKLNYRLYLGSNTSDNFDLNPNTNYIYQVNFAHKGLPTNDRRVSIIDPIDASEGNDFLSPTANCFMVAPGGAFCFDPFAYRQNGTDIENSTLKGWATNEGGIAYVKLLWQTKENGDLGDPVMGVVNSDSDHSNIVEIKRIDGKTGNPTEKGQARIYCRVAPNTTGGSGAIAAYNKDDKILWSWHVWVTDYAPDAKVDVSVDELNKRVQKYTYGNKKQYPMMDRNLGAQAGYTDIPEGYFAKAKANGFHYQWGRKDPFPSSYSASSEVNITLNSDKPTQGMLNLYKSDGISYFVRERGNSSVSVREAYKNPTVTYSGGNDWCNSINATMWNNSEGEKTVNDPCPAGWRIASKVNYQSFFTNTSYTESGKTTTANIPMNMRNNSTVVSDGGAVIYFENETSGRSTYIPMTGYQEYADQFNYIGGMGNLWCREMPYVLAIVEAYFPHLSPLPLHNISSNWAKRDGYTLRCIQDRSK